VLVAVGLSVGAVDLGVAPGALAAAPVGSNRGAANAAPVTEVLAPGSPTGSPVVVRGRATDDRAITKVKLTVKDRTTGRYWNPTTRKWQARWLWFDTTVVVPRARTTEWTFRFDPTGTGGSGRYAIAAVAWDDQGRRDPLVARRNFRVELPTGIPTTRITSPLDDEIVDAGPRTVTGTSTDDQAVQTVRVTIRDLGRNRYWNPELATWQAEWGWWEADLNFPGGRISRWSFPFDPGTDAGSGRYRVVATTWDTGGREDTKRSRVDYTSLAAPDGGGDGDGDGGDALTLVWNDEFNGTTLDPTRWKTFSGLYNTPYCVQNYTARSQNVRVENGSLVLEGHREASNGMSYTSGMVVSNDFRETATSSTRGNTAWRYGRYEMRARVPDAAGLWPAFWMRPADGVYGGWPRSGEIDILEYAGPTPTSWTDRRIVHDLHWWSATARDNNGSAGKFTPVTAAWLDQFHTFAIEWTPQGFTWFVDGRQTHQVRSGWSAPGGGPGAPFDQDFFITLNLQMGGWAGQVDNQTLPDMFEIDYVRVYQ
jgi:beta-glucanase (GH16 family)